MQAFDLQAQFASTPLLRISAETTGADAVAAMNVLTDFDDCAVGLAQFSGQTPWEWHPTDEMLLVLEGAVDIEVLPSEGAARGFRLERGQLCVVPARCWHRQNAEHATRLLFITSREGNDTSERADPRCSGPEGRERESASPAQ